MYDLRFTIFDLGRFYGNFGGMEHSDAVNLIRTGIQAKPSAQWADLGAGTGTFTRALADLLQPHASRIYAVDQSTSVLQAMVSAIGKTEIVKVPLDFVTGELPFVGIDGILMANALHYVKDKVPFLKRLRAMLNATGSLVVVEYDMTKPNAWVPFPVDRATLANIAAQAGFANTTVLGELPSRYNNSMYAARLTSYD